MSEPSKEALEAAKAAKDAFTSAKPWESCRAGAHEGPCDVAIIAQAIDAHAEKVRTEIRSVVCESCKAKV